MWLFSGFFNGPTIEKLGSGTRERTRVSEPSRKYRTMPPKGAISPRVSDARKLLALSPAIVIGPTCRYTSNLKHADRINASYMFGALNDRNG